MGGDSIAIAIKVEKGTEHQPPRTQFGISLKAVYSARYLFCPWEPGFEPHNWVTDHGVISDIYVISVEYLYGVLGQF